MLIRSFTITLSLLLLIKPSVHAQNEEWSIRTKEGASLGPKRTFIARCKKAYGAPADNAVITKICECEANLLDRRFTARQIKDYNKKYGDDAYTTLVQDDTALQRQTRECSVGLEQALLTIPGYRASFVTKCVDNLKANSPEPINDTSATIFCNCAAGVLEKRKVTLERFEELTEPSSFLYNEIVYKCGSPMLTPADFAPGWNRTSNADIKGDVAVDTVHTISLMGMHKIKITIGGITKIWLLDSGASDLFVSEAYAKELREKGVLTDLNYLGEGNYTLADNRKVSCKRYKVNAVKVGRFEVNNLVLAVSKHAKEFLLGKTLLNKFSQWTLDNQLDVLILKK